MTGRGRGRGTQPPQQPPQLPPEVSEALETPTPPEPVATHQPIEPPIIVEQVTQTIANVSLGRGRGRGRGHVAFPSPQEESAPTGLGSIPQMQPGGVGFPFAQNYPHVGPPAVTTPADPNEHGEPAAEINLPSQSVPVITRQPGGRGRATTVPTAPVGLPPPPDQPRREDDEVSVVTTIGITTTAGTAISDSSSISSVSGSTPAKTTHSGQSLAVCAQPVAGPSRAGDQIVATEPVQGRAAESAQEREEEGQDRHAQSADVEPENPPTFRGEKGDPVRLMSNFLRINVKVAFGLFEYTAKFEPNLEETVARKRVMKTLCSELGIDWTFDGRKLYMPVPLTAEHKVLTTMDPNDPSQVIKIEFKSVNTPMSQKRQFYNVLLRKVMVAMNYTEIKRNFYDPTKVTIMAQHNLEVWPGYITAIENYEGGLMLCMNTTSRVMRRDTVLDTLTALKQKDPSKYQQAFHDMILGTSVITRYNNKHYEVHDVDWNQTPTNTFQKKEQTVSYVDYFLSQHAMQIKNMTQPLIISRIKRRKNDPRGDSYYISLIPEFCNQSGLTDEMRANNGLMRDLVGLSRTTPMQRYKDIMEFLKTLNDTPKARAILEPWGVSLDARCLIETGRIINGPTLQFASFSIKSATADFTREATSNKCFQPVALKQWLIFCTKQDRDKADKMLATYKQVSGPLGIPFGAPPQFATLASSSGRMPTAADIRQIIRTSVAGTPNVQFIVVILPAARDDFYAAVKRFALIEFPLPSQVILSKTLMNDKKIRPVMQKVALQINCKLGGSIWALNIPLKELIMFVGIDSHHEPGGKKASVLALVASLNNYCTEYYSRVVNQGVRQESGDAISPIFNQALQAFYVANQRYPDRVVVFRDGVSDGEMDIVAKNEVTILTNVIKTVIETKVKFLFVVVQKRINERLFLIKPQQQLDNPLPGTIMDHTITRRGVYDFFLVSQLVRAGTVGPSHFVVVEDSGEGKPDLVQRLAFVTSFMYFNWPGTVRVPAMCQYAHKLAMLVGQHLDGKEPKDTMERKLYYL